MRSLQIIFFTAQLSISSNKLAVISPKSTISQKLLQFFCAKIMFSSLIMLNQPKKKLAIIFWDIVGFGLRSANIIR